MRTTDFFGMMARNAEGGGGGGDAGGGDPWYAGDQAIAADKEIVGYLEGKKFGSLIDALKSGMNSDRVARDRNVLERPDPQKLAEWKHWADLGFVEDEAKYAYKRPDLPQGMEYDSELEDAVRKIAHKNRVPLWQAQAILDEGNRVLAERYKQIQADGDRIVADGVAALQKEWGGDYEARRTLARRAAETLGVGKEEANQLGLIMGAPDMVKLFARIGEGLGEQKLVSSAGGGGFGGKSVAQAQAELNAFAADPAKMAALNNPAHPQHAAIKAEREALIRIKAGVA